MRMLLFVFLLFPLTIFADEVRIAVGISHDEAVALIKKHGGEDITSGQAILSKNDQPRPSALYWSFRDYDAIIEVVEADGKLAKMLFWNRKDFGESLAHRAKTEQSITALKLDTKTRGVSIEKEKNAG